MAAADSLTIRVGIEGGRQAASEIKSVGAAMGDAGKESSSLSSSFSALTRAGSALAPVMAGVGAAFATVVGAGAGFIGLLDSVSSSLDDLAKSAAAAGTTASDLDTLTGALGLLTDGSADAARLLQTLDRQLGKAATGSKEAAQGFDALGLSAEDLAGMSGTAKLALVADRMAALGSDADRAAVSARLFEDAGRSMAAVWRAGGDDLRTAADRVREAGVASDESAAAAEVYRDEVALLSRRLRVLRDEAIGPLLRPAAELVRHITDASGALSGSAGLNDLAYGLAGRLAAATASMEVAAAAASSLARQWQPLTVALGAAATGQWSVAAAALSTMGGVVDDVSSAAARANERLVETLNRLALAAAGVTSAASSARSAVGGIVSSGGGGRGLSLASSASEIGITDDVAPGALGSAVGEIRIETDQELLDAQAARLAAEEQAQRESLDRQLSMYSSFADSTASLFGTISDAVANSSKGQTREVRAALRAMFVAQKIVAIAQIAVNTAQSMMQTAANLGFPAAIPGMVAAGVAGGVATAAVVAQTVSGLVGDAGTMGDVSEQLRRMGFTGRQTVAIERGEVVMPREASDEARRLADSIGVAADRAASGGGGGAVNLLVQVGGEAVEAVVTRLQASAIMRGDMTLTNALGAAR